MSLLLLILPWFVITWGMALLTVARAGGWTALAQHYRAVHAPDGERFGMQSGRFGWVDYNGCLTIHIVTEGLYLSLMLPFRPFHPTLRIPWSDLHVLRVHEGRWFSYAEFSVGDPAIARIRLPLKVFEAARRLRSTK